MSWEAEQWAKRQHTGAQVLKATLVSIANWITPCNDWATVSIRRIADEMEISARSVQRHINMLVEMGFLEREERVRPSGASGWNAYRFRGYHSVKVSHLGAHAPEGEGDRLSPSRVTDCQGEGDTAVTPGRKDNINPPSPNGDAPQGAAERDRGSRLPDDWQPPAIADLPPAARGVASGWPAGAYAMVADRFRAHWRSRSDRGSRKRDWAQAWYEWILKAPRDVADWMRAGVDFAAMPGAAEAQAALVTGSDGCARSAAIRADLASAVEPAAYRAWLAPLHLSIAGERLVICTESRVRLDHVKNDVALSAALRRAAGGLDLHWQYRKGERRGEAQG